MAKKYNEMTVGEGLIKSKIKALPPVLLIIFTHRAVFFLWFFMQIMQPMRLEPQRCPKNLDDVLITSRLTKNGHRCAFVLNFMPFLQALHLFSAIACDFLKFCIPH